MSEENNSLPTFSLVTTGREVMVAPGQSLVPLQQPEENVQANEQLTHSPYSWHGHARGYTAETLTYSTHEPIETTVYPEFPNDHFVRLTEAECEQRKAAQWKAVEPLGGNDLAKILYLRRFTIQETARAMYYLRYQQQATSGLPFFGFGFDELSNPDLALLGADRDTAHDEWSLYDAYAIDSSRIDEIPSVPPYQAVLDIPPSRKIGIVIGYHHLEKAWGMVLFEAFQRQVQYSPDRLAFIFVENSDVPTGADSPASRNEILAAIHSQGITDIIDIHEMVHHPSASTTYQEHTLVEQFAAAWSEDLQKNPNGLAHTLDPTVPVWLVEQYFQGFMYPQLQYALNDQIKRIEALAHSLEAAGA